MDEGGCGIRWLVIEVLWGENIGGLIIMGGIYVRGILMRWGRGGGFIKEEKVVVGE